MDTIVSHWYEKVLLTIGTVILSLFLLNATPVIAGASGSANFNFSPASGSHAVGSTFTVNVREDSGAQAVNAVEADFSYDTSMLEYVGVDNSQSKFIIAASTAVDNGIVKLGRGNFEALTGSQLVAAVTFKVKTPGAATLAMRSSSAIIQANGAVDIWNGDTSNRANFSLTAAESSGTDNASKDTAPPSQGSAAGPSFAAITVVDANGKVLPKALVTIDGTQTVTTDAAGVASVVNLSPGEHTVSVTVSGKTSKSTIHVGPGGSSKPDELKVKLQEVKTNNSKSYWTAGLIATVIVGLLVLRGIVRRHPRLAVNGKLPKDQMVVGGSSRRTTKPALHQPGTVIVPTAPPVVPQPNAKTKERKSKEGS